MTTTNDLKQSALAYAGMGIPVFPCVPNEKRPATENGFYDASTDVGHIEATWTQNPNFNIGIRTGADLDGRMLVVVDVDPRNGGDTTLSQLQDVHGPLPDTARVITGRGDGGAHFYFLCLPGIHLKSKLGPGVDVQAEGKYIIAPPSIHPDTRQPYAWDSQQNLLAGAGIAQLPQWIVDACTSEVIEVERPSNYHNEIVFVDDDTVRDLRSALFAMRADDRDLWVRMGLALSELGKVGRALWMEWSSQSEKFDPRDAARTWESFL